jgi:dATP pyrophosphohydrolase
MAPSGRAPRSSVREPPWRLPGTPARGRARYARLARPRAAAYPATVRTPRTGFVEVYVFRRAGRRIRFLCLRRSSGEWLPGVWQPVTGRRRRGERPLAAAVREVREETGLAPRRWWVLESPTVFCDRRTGEAAFLPLFAAEAAPADRVRLSREHDAATFLPAREAGRRFLWEAQRRALADVRRQVLGGGPLADALEVTVSAGRRPCGPGARRRSGRGSPGGSSDRSAAEARPRRRRGGRVRRAGAAATGARGRGAGRSRAARAAPAS